MMRVGPVLALVLLALAMRVPASATSTYARQYGFSCGQCHTIIPQLNQFGENFKSNGYRIAGRRASGAVPVSMSLLATYSAARQGSGSRATVDEWRIQSGGALGPSVTYSIEQYLIDGGAPGSLDQAWLQYDFNTAHPVAKTDVRVRAGRLYLPLPIYADTYRPTFNAYAIFEQSVGENAFTLGETTDGVDVAVGGDYNENVLHAFASRSNVGFFGSRQIGKARISAYGVSGRAQFAGVSDNYSRQGLVAAVDSKRLAVSAAVQHGLDSNADGGGAATRSGGGFVQLEVFGRRDFTAAMRLDETFGDQPAQHALTTSLIFRPTGNTRLTIEDVLTNGEQKAESALLFAL